MRRNTDRCWEHSIAWKPLFSRENRNFDRHFSTGYGSEQKSVIGDILAIGAVYLKVRFGTGTSL